MLKQLDAIPATQLSAENQVNLAIYRPQIENFAAGMRFRDYEMPFNSDSQFWSDLGFMTRRPLKDALAARNYIAKLDDVPRYFDQQIANMRAGLKRGFSVPRAVLAGRDVSIAAATPRSKSAEESEFYAPFKKLPASIPPAEQEKLRADGATRDPRARDSGVREAAQVLPRRVRAERTQDARRRSAAGRQGVLPPADPGIHHARPRRPRQIHEIGLKEVARIARRDAGDDEGDRIQGRLSRVPEFLRTDPQFYAKTPDELLMRAAWIAKQVDGKLSQYFGFLPRGRFGIDPVPAAIAPFYTAGRGSARHVLGQHLRSAVAPAVQPARADAARIGAGPRASRASSPKSRRTSRSSAARTTSRRTAKAGRSTARSSARRWASTRRRTRNSAARRYEMWRAARLVIDTGIHHKGWTREQAIDYLADHTALSEHEVETEVDRYISWPGQALSTSSAK